MECNKKGENNGYEWTYLLLLSITSNVIQSTLGDRNNNKQNKKGKVHYEIF